MSGGVDSSVAAALLKEAGHEVIGVFMRLGSPGEEVDRLVCEMPGGATPDGGARTVRLGHQGCCSTSDAADARLVAARLEIPFYVVNFKKEFGRIIDYFADEYVAGRTPNPCVRCNDWLKFGKLREYARQVGAEFVASGHYARVERDPATGEPRLLPGVDASKDQSYVLFGVPREELGHMLLPIGGMQKAAVREEAKRRGLPVFDKPDSQEICFVPDNDYAGLVERVRPGARREGGRVLDLSGRVLGTHAGQHRFTLGQRRGLGLALGEPAYVVGKDAAANTVTVGPAEALLAHGCVAAEANWLIAAPATAWVACMAKIRYNARPVAARYRVIDPLPETAGPTPSGRRGRFEVEFAQAQSAVAPGQAVVLYEAEPGGTGWGGVIGGGWIS